MLKSQQKSLRLHHFALNHTTAKSIFWEAVDKICPEHITSHIFPLLAMLK